MNKKRKEIEDLIYSTFNILDKTGTNTKKYKGIFSKMNDDQFNKYMKEFLNDNDENFYLEIEPFEREPHIEDIKKALDFLKVPVEEYVYFPHLNEGGEPIRTKDRIIVGLN